jgi:hypothetical protein
MSLFGTPRDISLMRHINRELVNNIIQQQVGYYKIDLTKTTSNMYGESNGSKIYYNPVLINCIVERTPPTWTTDSIGPDISQDITVKFLRDDLAGIELSTELPEGGKGFSYGIVPEVGDIILWNNDYYDVDGTIENQLFVGKDPSYAYTDGNGNTDNANFGFSLSIIVNAHFTRNERLGITQDRL